MATTKYKISEQIQMMIGGNPAISKRPKLQEVQLLVEQVCNSLLKADHFNVNMPEGDTIPNNCMVFSYDDIDVTTYKTGKSKAKLPAMPISLPRNMGVLHVSKTDSIDEPFIPIPTSMYGIIKPQDLLGELNQLIGYEVVGTDIIFTKDLPGLGVTKVYIRLVGLDISQLGDFDLLPISADMEAQVIEAVYNLMVGNPKQDRTADSND
jgi:hypothetical protein